MLVREEIDLALVAHRVWKTRLKQLIEAGEPVGDIGTLRSNSSCTFGKWLNSLREDGIEDEHLNTVFALHTEFHEVTARVAETLIAGQRERASAMLDLSGEFSLASEKLIDAMLAWREVSLPS